MKSLFSINQCYTSSRSGGSNDDVLPAPTSMSGSSAPASTAGRSNVDLTAPGSMASGFALASWPGYSDVDLIVLGSTSTMATDDMSTHDEGSIPTRQILQVASIHP
jgi:hypothetical protein